MLADLQAGGTALMLMVASREGYKEVTGKADMSSTKLDLHRKARESAAQLCVYVDGCVLTQYSHE